MDDYKFRMVEMMHLYLSGMITDEEMQELQRWMDVAPDASTEILAAELDAVNSMENKYNVIPVHGEIHNAGKTFTYQTPARSINILRLRKI